MYTTKEIEALLDYGNLQNMSRIFTDLIKDHKERADKMRFMFDEYNGETEIRKRPIRTGDSSHKANNKLPNDYRGIIIDQALAYVFGKSIDILIGKPYDENEKVIKTLSDFKIENKIDDLDYETGFYAANCGYGTRLLYIDETGGIRVMNVKPWEAIIINSQTIEEPQYAMIYYLVDVFEAGNPDNKKSVYYVEWYDKENVYYYRENALNSGSYIVDPEAVKPSQKHGFDGIPVIKYKNNNIEKGDFEKVGDLIDAFDRVLSDSQNEIEDFRNAYMIFKGVMPDVATLVKAKETGAFGSDDKDFDISYLTKTINDTFVQNQKKTLNENIYKFSKRVDMSDENFSGSGQTGESRKWKLLALENDATIKEKKFRSANMEMYKLLCTAWDKSRKAPRDMYLALSYQFTRNLPVDLVYYGDVLTKYWGKLPIETIYSLLPFIEDPEEETAFFEEEKQANIDQMFQKVEEPENDED